MNTKSKSKLSLFDIFLYTSISLLSLIILYPFYYVLINSLNRELIRGPAFLFPSVLSFRNYNMLLSQPSLVSAFFMTVYKTIAGVISSVFVCASCAFALRKKEILFRNFYLILLTIPMFFSGGLIPSYLNLKMLGLLNNFLVYIIPGLVNFFIIIILMTSFNDIPVSLEESAKIDGAGYFLIFSRIFIPLSLPVLATAVLFIGVGQWNSWFETVYYTTSPSLKTLPAILIKAIAQGGNMSTELSTLRDSERTAISLEGIKMATMIIAVLPILFSYPFLQKYFVKGVMIGSIKG